MLSQVPTGLTRLSLSLKCMAVFLSLNVSVNAQLDGSAAALDSTFAQSNANASTDAGDGIDSISGIAKQDEPNSGRPNNAQLQFPEVGSKKGLQVEDIEDAISLGVKHAAFNLSLPSLVSRAPREDDRIWEYRGKQYRINSRYLESQARRIKAMSDSGALVYLILLNIPGSLTAEQSSLVHPNYSHQAPNGISAFNTKTADGRETFRAVMSFLANHFSVQSDGRWENGRVVGYIIGNEVNSHWWWYNMGEVSIDSFVEQYEEAVRVAHLAVTETAPWARVYISLEHHWTATFSPNKPSRSFAGRDFLQRFARHARERGDFAWHVAFHPYPENLFDPEFWHDKQAVWSEDTPKITFKNLGVLSKFLQRDEMLYAGAPRRIILSEQGFHTPKGDQGELVQAAAYCYAYRIADSLPQVDAFILHRHVDHPREGGLALGLWKYDKELRKRASKKRVYEVFKAADQSDWQDAFRFALPIIGIDDWGEAVQDPTER